MVYRELQLLQTKTKYMTFKIDNILSMHYAAMNGYNVFWKLPAHSAPYRYWMSDTLLLSGEAD
jgi:hypothetical protein